MKKHIKITNWYNYESSKGEVNSGELLVVPDDAYTIDEILEKFTRGIVLPVSRDGEYSDSEDYDDVDERSRIIDYADIDEAVLRVREKRAKKAENQTKKTGGLPEAGGGLQNAPKANDGVKTVEEFDKQLDTP